MYSMYCMVKYLEQFSLTAVYTSAVTGALVRTKTYTSVHSLSIVVCVWPNLKPPTGVCLADIVWISWLLVLRLTNITVSRVDGHLVARLWLFPSAISDCQQIVWKMVAGISRELKICCMYSSGRIWLTKRRFPYAPWNLIINLVFWK